MKIKKVILAGGGTAGHVNAGISILEEYKKSSPDVQTLFIGTKRGLESSLIPRAGFSIKYIKARGLKRESFFVFLYSLILVPVSIIQSLFILIKFNPQAVIGVGGFASGPVLLSAIFLRKKIFILEQNTIMGFTNRLFVKYAKKAFLAFPLAKIPFKSIADNFIITGNPVRSNIQPVNKKHKQNFNIFIFGGSQGARAINYCVIKMLPLLNNLQNINVVHQTGRHDFETVNEAYKNFQHPYEVFNYILDIENVYQKADLIIARSGASTVSELIITGIPSVLIPLPTAADNHQYYNAKYLSDFNSAILLEQKNLNPDNLFNIIQNLINNTDECVNIKNNLYSIYKNIDNPSLAILKNIEDSF